ncbi:MAG: PilZ domain-containing protein [Syntrophales bacterium]|nr:PilZ domain-containing protein [Syntrophales bacterium]
MRKSRMDAVKKFTSLAEISDHREFERYDIRVPARIETVLFGETQSFFLTTSNVSARGAYLATNRPLPEETELRIDFVLHFEKNGNGLTEKDILISVSAVVTRTDGEGMAVSFREDYKITYLHDTGEQGRALVH